MNKFYFKHRNVGLNPDTNKYYFDSIEDLINQVPRLKIAQEDKHHFKWSVSGNINPNQYDLVSEYWSTESNGTNVPLKCKGWWACGYIYTDETELDIHELLPKWKADYTNKFIESRYLTADDFSKLSYLDKEKCDKDGGIILNKDLNF